MEITVNNYQSRVQLEKIILENIQHLVSEILLREELSVQLEISINLVDDNYIRELNRLYRGKERSTDVLSFSLEEDIGEAFSNKDNQEILLGDVVISAETAARQADEYGHLFSEELYFLVIHGVLHLLGYDHKEKEEASQMKRREKELWALTGGFK